MFFYVYHIIITKNTKKLRTKMHNVNSSIYSNSSNTLYSPITPLSYDIANSSFSFSSSSSSSSSSFFFCSSPSLSPSSSTDLPVRHPPSHSAFLPTLSCTSHPHESSSTLEDFQSPSSSSFSRGQLEMEHFPHSYHIPLSPLCNSSYSFPEKNCGNFQPQRNDYFSEGCDEHLRSLVSNMTLRPPLPFYSTNSFSNYPPVILSTPPPPPFHPPPLPPSHHRHPLPRPPLPPDVAVSHPGPNSYSSTSLSVSSSNVSSMQDVRCSHYNSSSIATSSFPSSSSSSSSPSSSSHYFPSSSSSLTHNEVFEYISPVLRPDLCPSLPVGYRKNFSHKGVLLTLESMGSSRHSFLKRLREKYSPEAGEIVVEVLYLYGDHIHRNDPVVEEQGKKYRSFIMDLLDALLIQKYLPAGQRQKLNFTIRLSTSTYKLPISAHSRSTQVEFLLNPSTRELLPSRLSFGSDSMMLLDKKRFDVHLDFLLWQKSREIYPSPELIDKLVDAYVSVNEILYETFQQRGMLFGSSSNGFTITSSDLDIVVQFPDNRIRELLKEAHQAKKSGEKDHSPYLSSSDRAQPIDWSWLKRLRAAPGIWAGRKLAREFAARGWAVECVEAAKFPIVRLKYPVGGRGLKKEKGNKENMVIDVDVSFNHEVVIHNTRLFRAYAAFDTRVTALGRLVKHWAKKRDICDSYRGSLSGYSWLNLVVYFCQRTLVPSVPLSASSSFVDYSSIQLPFSQPTDFVSGTSSCLDSLLNAVSFKHMLPLLPNLQQPPPLLCPRNHEEDPVVSNGRHNVYFFHPIFGPNRLLQPEGDDLYNNSEMKETSSSSFVSSSSSSFSASWEDDLMRVDPREYARRQLDTSTLVESFRNSVENSLLSSFMFHSKPAVLSRRNMDVEEEDKFLCSVMESPGSLLHLLYSFFRFYGGHFNFYRYVIDIDSTPQYPMAKIDLFSESTKVKEEEEKGDDDYNSEREGKEGGHDDEGGDFCEEEEENGRSTEWLRKRPFLCIRDPFEKNRTLGTFRFGQEYISRELLRGVALLSSASSGFAPSPSKLLDCLFSSDNKGDGRHGSLRKDREGFYAHPSLQMLRSFDRHKPVRPCDDPSYSRTPLPINLSDTNQLPSAPHLNNSSNNNLHNRSSSSSSATTTTTAAAVIKSRTTNNGRNSTNPLIPTTHSFKDNQNTKTTNNNRFQYNSLSLCSSTPVFPLLRNNNQHNVSHSHYHSIDPHHLGYVKKSAMTDVARGGKSRKDEL